MVQVEYAYKDDGIQKWHCLDVDFKDEIVCPMIVEGKNTGEYMAIAGKWIYRIELDFELESDG